MKIIHIANHAERTGNGIVNAMVDLACAQAKMGHEVLVISGGGDFVPLLESASVRHLTIPHRAILGIELFKSLVSIALTLRREKPDVVHCHMVAGLMLAKSARALSVCKSFLLVSTIHNEFQRSAMLMAWADVVVGVSAAVTSSMRSRGAKAAKLATICNGVIGSVRLGPLPPLEGREIAAGTVITVAGMYRRKGIDVLLHAFSAVVGHHPAAKLLIVGDGPERADFEELTTALGLDQAVEFLGLRQDARELMCKAEVFVLASRRDPCPLVIAEAREAACAIVASDVDGIPELLEFGKAGRLVPADDAPKLATAISEILADVGQRKALQLAASTNIEWLTIDRVAAEYVALYKERSDAEQMLAGKSQSIESMN